MIVLEEVDFVLKFLEYFFEFWKDFIIWCMESYVGKEGGVNKVKKIDNFKF